jgi:ABC-type multidrug transport system ATPase subunit
LGGADVIHVDAVTKRYGKTLVLDDVSLEVADGEAIALWGPNGSGKTTVIRCILDQVRFDGTIEVNGLDVTRQPKSARSQIGYVAQDSAFYDHLTVAETLDLAAGIRRLSADRVAEVVAIVDIGDHATKRIRELSGGLKQRLGVALALLPDPPVLLLDEPTSSLDVAARESMIRLIESLRTPERMMIVTSHHVGEVGMLVDRVVALEQGRVALECAPTELAERLELRSWLHLVLTNGQIDQAVEILLSDGFDAHRNGHGVIVAVSAQHKTSALSRLQEAGIEIRDFEVWR